MHRAAEAGLLASAAGTEEKGVDGLFGGEEDTATLGDVSAGTKGAVLGKEWKVG